MNPITQLNTYGCGLACISFICQKSYFDILILTKLNQAKTKGFTCKELVSFLSKFNRDYAYRYIKPKLKKKIYQDKVIIFIKRSVKYPVGHYLVRSNGMWMDPWVNFQNNREIKKAKSGFRRRLPGTPIYVIFPSAKMTNK